MREQGGCGALYYLIGADPDLCQRIALQGLLDRLWRRNTTRVIELASGPTDAGYQRGTVTIRPALWADLEAIRDGWDPAEPDPATMLEGLLERNLLAGLAGHEVVRLRAAFARRGEPS